MHPPSQISLGESRLRARGLHLACYLVFNVKLVGYPPEVRRSPNVSHLRLVCQTHIFQVGPISEPSTVPGRDTVILQLAFELVFIMNLCNIQSMQPQTRRVMVVLERGSQYSVRLLDGAIRYAARYPWIHLIEADSKSGEIPEWLDRLTDYDGLLLWVNANEKWVPRLLRPGVPVVNMGGGWPLDLMPMVAFSGKGILHAAMDHLAGLRRHSVAMMWYNSADDPIFAKRKDAFVRLAGDKGLSASYFDAGQQRSMNLNPPLLTKRGEQRLRTFLRQLPLPAAVWAMDDFFGQAIIETAKTIGLKVPGQLAVLGLGDYTAASCCNPQLSTIPQPGEIIGFEAMRVLHGMMNGRQPAQMTIRILPPPVVMRESTNVEPHAERNIMQDIHAFITARACMGIKVDDLLKMTDVSLPTLYKQFTEIYGRAPGAEIRRVKIERAKSYLKTTTLSITRVADLCGYNQYTKFVNFFKRETGKTPSGYRTSVTPGRHKGSL